MSDTELGRQEMNASQQVANGISRPTRTKWGSRFGAARGAAESEPEAPMDEGLESRVTIETLPQPTATNARPQRPVRGPRRQHPKGMNRSSLMSIIPVSAPVVLMVGPFVTVLVYVIPVGESNFTWWSRWGSAFALGAGVFVAVGVAVLYAIVQRGQAAPEQVNSRLYSELRDRWNAMDAHLNVLCPRSPSNNGVLANGAL
ncbi:MAG: hypothetical protein M3121_04190, partial [Chloroflexota bacterium]|nr:hypothetical protein [Chloroflexota bacterium]